MASLRLSETCRGRLLSVRVVVFLLAMAAATGQLAAGRWLPGDTHSHISPPDVPPTYNHAANDLEGAIASARRAGLKWLIITPHAMDRKDEKSGRLWAVEMADRLAGRKSAADDPLVVLGWERTFTWPGHLTISFVELTTVVTQPLEKVLARVREQGGLAIVAHPYQLPTVFVKGNRSWRPWTEGPAGQELDPWLTGLEIRHPISPAALAIRRWDEWIAGQKRRIVGVGATDDHWGTLYPTTWVYIEGDLTRDKLRDALKAGRVVVGEEPIAGSLLVTSDRRGKDGKPIQGKPGDAVAADRQVTVSWKAPGGRLFVDGKLQKVEGQRIVHKFAKGGFHWYRLEVGIRSYSNPVYVNLPPEEAPPPIKPASGSATKSPEARPDEESEAERTPTGAAPPAGSAPKRPGK